MLEMQETTIGRPRRRPVKRVVTYPEQVSARFDRPTFDALIATAAKMGVAKGRLVAEIVEDALRRVGALAEPTDRAA